jgi:cytochrome bd-type quinol oxidase subunit 2
VRQGNERQTPSVWLTQILLIIFALLCLGIIVLNLVTLPSRIAEGASILRFVIVFSIIFCFVFVLLIAFWGLLKRKKYGRWLGLVSLILIWGLVVYIKLFPATGRYKTYEYDNAAQLAGAFLALSLIHALFLIVILRLAFSKKVRQFFLKDTEHVEG